jgi:hypothetical protein
MPGAPHKVLRKYDAKNEIDSVVITSQGTANLASHISGVSQIGSYAVLTNRYWSYHQPINASSVTITKR